MSVGKMLTGHEFFHSFLPEQVAAISKFASARKLDKGEIIYRPDRKATHVFVLLDGQVELRLPSGADEMGFLVSRVSKGEFFGIAPFLAPSATPRRPGVARPARCCSSKRNR